MPGFRLHAPMAKIVDSATQGLLFDSPTTQFSPYTRHRQCGASAKVHINLDDSCRMEIAAGFEIGALIDHSTYENLRSGCSALKMTGYVSQLPLANLVNRL
jgi:hypothetical protein